MLHQAPIGFSGNARSIIRVLHRVRIRTEHFSAVAGGGPPLVRAWVLGARMNISLASVLGQRPRYQEGPPEGACYVR